jgi:23S rRNA (adenine2503-C2)-methyltransferase
MYAQVMLAQRESLQRWHHPLSNLVWMGMGEPMLNFGAVKAAVERVTASDGMSMSPSRITISTSGVCEGILRLSSELPSVNLAVSLHTADDRQRCELMPVGRKYPLAMLSDTLFEYHRRTGNRITIEYMLMDRVNDTPRHAMLLLKFCRRFPVKINIIEYNPHPHAPYLPSETEREEAFVRMLKDKNLIVNVRKSKGRDIDAACGQLANKRRLR